MVIMAFIVGWYYAWVYGIGIANTVIHVGSLFVAVPIGQLLAIHVYGVIQPRRVYQVLSSLLLILFGVRFIYFTFVTPDLPFLIYLNMLLNLKTSSLSCEKGWRLCLR